MAREAVETLSGRKKKQDVKAQELPFSRDAKRVFESALSESRRLGMNFIAPEHVLVALVSIGDVGARRVLERLGVNVQLIKAEAIRKLKGEQEGEGQRKKAVAGNVSSRSSSDTKALEEFCRDLCEEARSGKMDPVIGRDKEVTRVIQILARRSKNNPILLGEAGVGKTAIAEGLANAIVAGCQHDGTPLPDFLKGKRVMSLDVGLLIAGAKERGELESRVTKILAETAAAGNIVLMIDEIHTLVGTGAVGRGSGGGSGGGLDISNLLKPALARGKLQCIGATTRDEHRKHIEKDAALERRFQPVIVDEPSQPDALRILEGLKVGRGILVSNLVDWWQDVCMP
jgi:ATP-dependent Clp protease ATP-binding subunit ClpC